MGITITDRVGAMEGKMEELYLEVKLGMDTIKSEFQGQLASLMEKFSWIANKWDEQERGIKGKDQEGDKQPEGFVPMENSPGNIGGSSGMEGKGKTRISVVGGWRCQYLKGRTRTGGFLGQRGIL
ncbi:hypothetical protein Adt_35797 [Abeliophyllum distichum]|uniref:Uncharacterized protein n=1 Tax=Abeliophyllum distichum TaxID=126358 RepID=A0ABD1QJP8_9LAMI